MRWVTSKSAMVLAQGPDGDDVAGVRPIICHASWPMASTSCVRLLSAMTEGSFSTMPSPLT